MVRLVLVKRKSKNKKLNHLICLISDQMKKFSRNGTQPHRPTRTPPPHPTAPPAPPQAVKRDVIVQHFKPDLTSRNCVTYAIAQVALQREKGTIKGRSDDGDLSTITQCSLPTEKAGGFYFVSVGNVSLCMCRQRSPGAIILPVLLQSADLHI